MKSFHDDRTSVADATADAVVEVSVRVMRRLRAQLRSGNPEGLSFTQVRSLACLQQTPGASVTDVSEFLGLQAPTASKTIDELVQAGLVRRDTAADDRRRVTLYLTGEGERALARAVEPARRGLTELFSPLSEADREVVGRAMSLLLPLLDPCVRSTAEVAGE